MTNSIEYRLFQALDNLKETIVLLQERGEVELAHRADLVGIQLAVLYKQYSQLGTRRDALQADLEKEGLADLGVTAKVLTHDEINALKDRASGGGPLKMQPGKTFISEGFIDEA